MKLSSCEGRKHNCNCKLCPLHHTTCACASCGEPSAPQEQEELLVWAKKCPVWSQLQFHFCHSSDLPAGLPKHKLRSTMVDFIAHAFLPSSLTLQHRKLPAYVSVSLCGPACFSGTKGPNPCLIPCRLWDFCNEFSCGQSCPSLTGFP